MLDERPRLEEPPEDDYRDPQEGGSRFPVSPNIAIGAATVLIAILAVFFAYNANSGLPFVPTYDINAQAPNASELQAGNSVMIGGTRVGYVSSISSGKTAAGKAIAILHLKLDKSVEPLPADSTDLVRPVSPLGLKYLQITRGNSKQTLAPGATIPLSHTSLPVEIDDFFDIFNPRVRQASQTGLTTFGEGLGGRGKALNEALGKVKSTVDALLPVMNTLMLPQTRWAQFFPSLERAASEVAGVARQQADLFKSLDETFTPLSQEPGALQATIKGGPAALQTATRQLPRQAQFVDDTTRLFRKLRPAFRSLATASRSLAPAEAAGIPALRKAPGLNSRLLTTFTTLQRFAGNEATLPGLILLTDTAQILEPTIAFLEPAQTTCNYFTLFFRNLENSLSESNSVGSMLSVLAILLPQQAGSEAGPASQPADGPAQKVDGVPLDSFLHSDPTPYTAAPGEAADVCEAGNEKYMLNHVEIGNVPVVQKNTELTKRVMP